MKGMDKGLLNNQISNAAEVDVSMTKIVGLGGASAIVALAAGLFVGIFLEGGGGGFAIAASVAGMLLLALFFLNTIFIKTPWVGNFVIFSECAALVCGAWNVLGSASVMGGLLACAIMIGAAHTGRDYVQNLLKIRLWQVARVTLPRAILALAVFVSAVSYSSIEKVIAQQEEFFVSIETFENIVLQSASLVSRAIPEIDLTKSAGEVFVNIATRQVENIAEVGTLPPSAKKQLINQTRDELQKQIASYFNANPQAINLNEEASKELYALTAQRFSELNEASQKRIAAVVSIIIFLTVASMVFPVRLCVAVIAIILYETLLGLNFARVTLEGRSREIIILK